MQPEIFVLLLGVILAGLLFWGFKTLPGEGWQVIGCLLSEKDPDGVWKGMNLTYYGFFNATAYLLAAVLFFILMGSLSVPVFGALAILTAILTICMPASKLIAFWVEGRVNTFTVGGASFVGLIAAPWIIQFINREMGIRMGFHAPVLRVLAAIAIAYAVGEGIGRLACISFGCCYGKPLSSCHPMLQRIFEGRAFIFSGQTKKIAYAHHLDGREVIPIQAVTAILFTGAGMLGCYGFLKGFHFATFAGLLVVTQAWRALSEFVRADYRGTGSITAYQVMAVLSVIYAFLLLAFFPADGGELPDLMVGLLTLWDPGVILFFELLWIAAFVHTGRSRVTGATVRLHVVKENI
ncbi:MAG: prolipoprotein diacylglyceryl transferase [Deltaproteobacteria bacterium]|nr:MAG: prolipoprotein diacylglyceryl transferase [Deltaproteobacteria bacterium]